MRTFYIYNAEGEKSWIQWVDYGLTDEDGNVTEIQAIGRDVTPLIEAQQEIADREKMLSTIFNNIPIMLTQFDNQGNFEYVNRHWEDVLGWPIEDIQAHPDFLSAIATTAEQRDEIFEYMMSGHIGWEDFTLRVRDGSLIETSWANVRLSDNRHLGIGQVITQRKELENQRVYTRQLEIELEKERELRELKDRFVSMVSHEFRTPLSVMTASLDIVTRYHDRLSNSASKEKLSVVSQQVQRMVRLMDDVLRFSKGEAGKTSFVPQAVPVIPFCNQVIETLKITDNAKHDIVINGDEGSIMADPRLLDHILSNLVSNALKYSPKNTPVHVTAQNQGTHWQFTVSDQGIGIPAEDIPNLFDPFYRSDNVHHLPGTGLGLSIVKDYVRMHNGTIDVESKINQGTTFIITLPSEQNTN